MGDTPETIAMGKARARVVVSGLVQGVYFRDSTRRVASGLGVTGWVRNLPDGRVEATFEGEEQDVRTVIEWCHRGPAHAEVDSVEVEWKDFTGQFDCFVVR